MSAGSPSFPINSFQIGSGPAASYFQSISQSIPHGINTVLNFQTKEFDTDSAFNINTGTFQPKMAGIYQINGAIAGVFSPTELLISIYKNGVAHKRGVNSASALNGAIVSSLVALNGNDYIDIRGWQATGVPVSISTGAATYFNAVWIRGL